MAESTGPRAPSRWRELLVSAVALTARLACFTAAVALAAIAYREHLDPRGAWQTWTWKLASGVVLVCLAFWDGRRPDRGKMRWAIRIAGGAVAVWAGWRGVALAGLPGMEIQAGVSLLAALAGFLVFRWVPLDPVDVRALLAEDAVPRFTGPRVWLAVAMAAAGVGLGALATWLNRSNHLLGFGLWLASLVVFAAAMWRRDVPASDRRWRQDGGPELSLSLERAALLAILLFAVALRFTLLEDVPAWINPDEGRLGRYAERMWSQGFPDAFGLGWNAFPHLSYMVQYVGVQLFGMSNPHFRLSSAAIGTLSLVPVFYWVRGWWGNVIALFTTFLLATNQIHLMWSRIGFNNIHQVLVAGLILCCFARVLRWHRAIDWVWLGYSAGLTFHTYHAAKLFPALLVPIGLVLAASVRGFLGRYLPGLAVGAVAFVLCLGPLIPNTLENWEFFSAATSNRVDAWRLVDAYHASDTAAVRWYLEEHIGRCIFAFTKIPTVANAYLSAVVAIPFVLGVGWMLWRWRDPRHLTVLVWIGGILSLGGFVTDYPPATTRMLGFFPAVCLVAAVVAGRLRALLCRIPRIGGVVFWMLAVAWLGTAAYLTWHNFFVVQPPTQRGHPLSEICRVIRNAPLPSTLYMVGGDNMAEPRVAAHDCMIADVEQRRFVNPARDSAVVPLPPDHTGYAIIMVARMQRELAPLVQRHYPEAHLEVVYNDIGAEVMKVFTIDPRQVALHRGLRGEFRAPQRRWRSDQAESKLVPPRGSDFPVSAVWTGQLFVPEPGSVELRAAGAEVEVGGSRAGEGNPRQLAEGWHPIEIAVEYGDSSDPAVVLEWKRNGEWSAVPNQNLYDQASVGGLLGRYFDRAIDSDEATPIRAAAAYESIETVLSFSYRTRSDDPPPEPFASLPSTMEWIGSLDLANRVHRLRVEATTPTRVFIDGELVAELEQAGETFADLPARPGRRSIVVRNVRPQDSEWRMWTLRVLWQEPGGIWTATANYEPPAPQTAAPDDPDSKMETADERR